MQKTLSKKVLAVLASAVLLVCSFAGTFTVSAEGPQVYDIGGVKHAFAAADGSVTYSGTDYAAYATLEDAYKAVIATGGVVVVEGTQAIYTEAVMDKHVKFTGADSSATITIPSYKAILGDVEFENLKFNSSTGGTVEWWARGNVTFGAGVTMGGNHHGLVAFDSASAIDQLNAGDTLTMRLSSPTKLYYLRLNGATGTPEKNINLQVVMDGMGYSSGYNKGFAMGGTVNGSFTLVVNDSSRFEKKDGTAKTFDITGSVTNAFSVIFNNGVSDVVLNDANSVVDYVLNVANGGYAYVKTEGTATAAPTFVISHKDGFVPVIGGQQLQKTGDEYLYTPTATGTTDITFIDPTPAQVYDVEGEKFVFAAADGEIEYKGTTYYTYDTFELAYKAIKDLGGNIVFEGEHNFYTDQTTTKAIKVIGSDRATSILALPNTWLPVLYGELYLKDLTLKNTNGGARLLADRLTLDNVNDANNNIWFLGFRTGAANGATCYLNIKAGTDLNLVGIHEESSVAADRLDNMHFIFDGGSINWNPRVTKPVYGNLTYTVNKVPTIPSNNKKISISSDPTGALTLIFNNGITDLPVDGNSEYVDYRLNVATNGYATLKTEATATTAPTFVITHNKGWAPFAEGAELQKTGDEYLYTPSAKGTFAVTFVNPNPPQVYEIGGKKYAFASADGIVEYDADGDGEKEQYNAYETFELAYKAIVADGGVIVVNGEQTLYTENTATKAIDVIGADKANATLVTGTSWTYFIYGEMYFQNLTLKNGSTDTQRIFGDRLTLDNVSMKGPEAWFAGFRTGAASGTTCYVRLKNTRVGMIGSHEFVSVSDSSRFDNFHYFLDEGSSVHWNIRPQKVMYGNLTYTINTSAGLDSKKMDVTADPTGAFSVIFNNGINDVAVNDANNYIDYLVKVANGGHAYLKTEGTATAAPSFVIVPAYEEFKVHVNGNELQKNPDGEYVFTPTQRENNITFSGVEMGPAHKVGGKTYFIAAAKVNGIQPVVELDLGDGVKKYLTMDIVSALNEAGKLAPEDKPVVGLYGDLGEVNISGHNAFTTTIEVIGLTDDAAINASWRGLTFNGPVFLDKFHIFTSQNSDENLFFKGYDVTIGENLTSDNDLWVTPVYSGPKGNEVTKVVINAGGLKTTYFQMLNMDDGSVTVNNQKVNSVIGSATDKKYMDITINNITTTQATQYGNEGGINMGSRNNGVTFVGNAILRINGGTFAVKEIQGGKPNHTLNAIYDGILTVIVNSSVEMSVAENFKPQVDYYVVNNNKTGTVDVKDIKADNHTFIITPKYADATPYVNGVELTKNPEGKYEYTPEVKAEMQVLNVTYKSPLPEDAAFKAALDSFVLDDSIVTGQDFADVLAEKLQCVPDVINVEDFYHLRPTRGAKANGEILVPGQDGYAAVVISLVGSDRVYTKTWVRKHEVYDLGTLTVSDEMDFTYGNTKELSCPAFTGYKGDAQMVVFPAVGATIYAGPDFFAHPENVKVIVCNNVAVDYHDGMFCNLPNVEVIIGMDGGNGFVSNIGYPEAQEIVDGYDAQIDEMKLKIEELKAADEVANEEEIKTLEASIKNLQSKKASVGYRQGLFKNCPNLKFFVKRTSDLNGAYLSGVSDKALLESLPFPEGFGTLKIDLGQLTGTSIKDLVIRSGFAVTGTLRPDQQLLVVGDDTDSLAKAWVLAQYVMDNYEGAFAKAAIAEAVSAAFAKNEAIKVGFSSWAETRDSATALTGKVGGVMTLTKNGVTLETALEKQVSVIGKGNTIEDRIESALNNYKFTNDSDEAELEELLSAALLSEAGASISVEDFYLYEAIEGVEDKDGVIVPGTHGYVSAVVKLTTASGTKTLYVKEKVEAPLDYLEINSVSKPEDFILSDDGKCVIAYNGTAEKIVIPDGVEEIDIMWIDINEEGRRAVKAIVLPDSMISLPYAMCSLMYNLKAFYMPDTVVNDPGNDEYVFQHCWTLEYVHISEGWTEIPVATFQHAKGLRKVHIPGNVTSIYTNAFNVTNMNNVILGVNVENILDYAFHGMYNITTQLGAMELQNYEDWLKVSKLVVEEVMPDFYAKGRHGYRITTVLNPEAMVGLNAFKGGGRPNMRGSHVRTQADGDNVYVYEDLLGQGASAEKTPADSDTITVEDLVMTLAEAAAYAQMYADDLVLDNNADADAILAKMAIIADYVDGDVTVEWKDELAITEATKSEKGKATGVAVMKTAAGETFEITIDEVLSYAESDDEGDNDGEGDGEGDGNEGGNDGDNTGDGDGGDGNVDNPNEGYQVPVAIVAILMAAALFMMLKSRKVTE